MCGILSSDVTDSVAKNTLYLTLASVGQKVLAFVYFIFLARIMQPEATGAYFLALSIVAIFSVVADFGVTQVVIREVAKTPEQALHQVRRALGLKLPFIVLGAIGANAAALMLQYDAQIQGLVLFASIILAADAISLFYYGILRGHHRLQFESLGIFVGQLFTVVAGGTVLLLDPRLELLVIALMFGSVFNMLFSAKQVSKLLGPKAFVPEFDRSEAVKLMRIALPFFLAGVFVKVYSYVDSIFLSKFISTEAVGLYSIPYKITYAFQFLPLAFVAALYPSMSALVGRDHKALTKLFNDAMWYMIILAAPIAFGIWAIAPDLVMLAGDDYRAAAPVLSALVFVLIPIFLDFPIGSLLNAADRQTTKMALMGVTMVINVILNFFLIPPLGIMGAAWAALGSFTFLFVGGLWFVPKIIPSYKFLSLARVVGPILASGAIMGAVAFWLRPMIGYILVVPVGAVVYVAMLIATGSVRKVHVEEAMRLFKRKTPVYATTSPHDD